MLLWLLVVAVVVAVATATAATEMVDCDSTKGPFSIEVKPDWAPLGAERFLALVDAGFYTQLPLLRCIRGFLCQFGYSGNEVQPAFDVPLADDVPGAHQRFHAGYVSFAGNGPHSRTRHVFITLGEHVRSLGREDWETPFGMVTRDSFQATVAKFSTRYGDDINPHQVEAQSPQALHQQYPHLDYIVRCHRRRTSGEL